LYFVPTENRTHDVRVTSGRLIHYTKEAYYFVVIILLFIIILLLFIILLLLLYYFIIIIILFYYYYYYYYYFTIFKSLHQRGLLFYCALNYQCTYKSNSPLSYFFLRKFFFTREIKEKNLDFFGTIIALA